jgi:transcriptional regulator with XRE-family HTH domain
MKNITPYEFNGIKGKNVAKYRKAKNITQLELSLQIGYKSVLVVSGSEVCYGNKHFNLEQILKISQILDVELCEFLKPIVTK